MLHWQQLQCFTTQDREPEIGTRDPERDPEDRALYMNRCRLFVSCDYLNAPNIGPSDYDIRLRPGCHSHTTVSIQTCDRRAYRDLFH